MAKAQNLFLPKGVYKSIKILHARFPQNGTGKGNLFLLYFSKNIDCVRADSEIGDWGSAKGANFLQLWADHFYGHWTTPIQLLSIKTSTKKDENMIDESSVELPVWFIKYNLQTLNITKHLF